MVSIMMHFMKQKLFSFFNFSSKMQQTGVTVWHDYFGLYLTPYFRCANGEDSNETAKMCFAGQLFDNCHNLKKSWAKLAHKQSQGGGLVQWLALMTKSKDQGVPGSRPGLVAVRCGLEQVTFTPCLVLDKPRRLTWTDCDKAGD